MKYQTEKKNDEQIRSLSFTLPNLLESVNARLFHMNEA
jgi:hypothetical protein